MKNLLPLILLTGLVLTVYLKTVAPSLTWHQPELYEGTLATAAYNRDFALTPLSPTYLILSQPLTLLPLDPVFRLNLMSILCGTAAVAACYLIILKLTTNIPAALLGALTLAFAKTFWEQALYTNVYSLTVLFLTLALLFYYYQKPKAAFLFLGLAISSHLSLISALPAFMLGEIGAVRGRRDRFKEIGKQVAALLIPPLALFTPSASFSNLGREVIRWFEPFWPGSFSTVWANFLSFLEIIPANFNAVTLTLALAGTLWGFSGDKLNRKIRWLLPGLFFVGLGFNIRHTSPDISPYYLPQIIILSLWAGLGANVVGNTLTKLARAELAAAFENRFFLLVFRLKKEGRILKLLVNALLLGLLVAPPAQAFLTHFGSVDQSTNRAASRYAIEAISNLPNEALVIAENREMLTALSFYQEVVYQRPDITIVATDFLLDREKFARLQSDHPELRLAGVRVATTPEKAAPMLEKFVTNNLYGRPIYLTLSQPAVEGAVAFWVQFRLTGESGLYRVSLK